MLIFIHSVCNFLHTFTLFSRKLASVATYTVLLQICPQSYGRVFFFTNIMSALYKGEKLYKSIISPYHRDPMEVVHGN